MKNEPIRPGLKRLKTFINRNYRIKVYDVKDYKKLNKLVGISGLYEVVNNDALTHKILLAAWASRTDRYTRKLPRGIKILFYAK